MDYRKELDALKDKIQAGKDVIRAEQCFWEARNELVLRREQVAQLEQQLSNVNNKNFHLSRELEASESLVKESEFNVKLTLKKCNTFDKKIKEINEDYTNLKLNEEMRIAEIQILKDMVQKVAYEKEHLEREVRDLKNKLALSQSFQEELNEKQNVLNTKALEVKQNVEIFIREQHKLTEMERELQNSEGSRQMSLILVEQVKKLKKEKTDMENELIETNAKIETLKSLLAKGANSDGQLLDKIQKLKFHQYEERCKKLIEENTKYEEQLATITAELMKERKENAELIIQIEDNEAHVK